MRFNRIQNLAAIMIAFATCGICVANLFSQTSSKPRTLIVEVFDQLKGRIVGAEIILRSKGQEENEFQPELEKSTNNEGVAEFNGLTRNEFELSIHKDGFKSIEIDIDLRRSKTVTKRIVLKVAEFNTSMDVNSNDSSGANMESFGGTRDLTLEEIESLPDDPEEMELRLRELAGIPISGNKVPIKVNGFSGGQLPPKEAIRQIRINKNIFSAQYEDASGGGIEIFTRSGVDQVSGGIGGEFMSSAFNARNPFLLEKPNEFKGSYGGNILFPIVPKKASMFLNLSLKNNESNSAINATILDETLSPANFRSFALLSERIIRSSPFADIDINERHQLHLGFQFEDILNRNQGLSTFDLPSMSFDNKNQTKTFQLSENATLSNSTANQFRFQLNHNSLRFSSENNGVTTEVQDAFTDGSAQRDSSTRVLTFEASNDFFWQKDRVNVIFGASARGLLINAFSNSNSEGRYIFSGRLAPILDANDNPVLDSNGEPTLETIESLEAYRRHLLFERLGYSPSRIRSLGGGASQFAISGGEPNSKIDQLDYSLYLQNNISLRNDLAFSVGLRYENQTNIKSNLNFAPRFGVVWAPAVNQKNKSILYRLPKFSAGIGLFYERVSGQLFYTEAQSVRRSEYLIQDSNILDMYPDAPSVEQLGRFAVPKSIKTVSPDIRPPRKVLASLVIEKQLPFKINLGSTIALYRVRNALRTSNINAPIAGSFDQNDVGGATYPFGYSYGDNFQTSNSGELRGTNLVVYLRINNFRSAKFNFNYNYRNSKDNLVSGSGSYNPYDYSNEYGVSDNNLRHSFFMLNNFRLPKGFGLDTIFNLGSGLPFNITLGRDLNGDKLYLERPAFASDSTKAGLVATPYGLLDPNPEPADLIIPRNLGRGPSFMALDLSLRKNFGFGRDQNGDNRFMVNLRVIGNNILNSNNKAAPIGNMASPIFLQSVTNSTNSVGFFGAIGPRKFRFSIGLRF